jgi:hypothetical protein
MPIARDSKRNLRRVPAVTRLHTRLVRWLRSRWAAAQIMACRTHAAISAYTARVPASTLQIAEAIPRHRQA